VRQDRANVDQLVVLRQVDVDRNPAANESIHFVLLLVVLLIFLGIFLYAKFFTGSLQQRADTLSEREATLFLSRFSSLAEVRCADKPCLDTSKFFPFHSLTQQHRTYYTQLFGNQKISVAEVYPVPASSVLCTRSLYLQPSYPGSCSTWVLYEQRPATSRQTMVLSTVVSLYYPEQDLYTLGTLTVEVYR